MAGEKDTTADPREVLTGLRGEIDRIDAAMHALLMERGAIIDRLIATKGSGGSAFRPEREASMTRTLIARHRGILPVEAVEGIWRVIIATFTHVQAPFSVHVPAGSDTLRDSARFHFGFTVPLRTEPDVPTAIEAVASSRGDLALIPIGQPVFAWWDLLRGADAPKIIARLPFGAGPAHPAGLPAFAVSRMVSGEGVGAIVVHAARGARTASRIAEAGGEVLAQAGAASLLAAPKAAPTAEVASLVGTSDLLPVGSYPEPVWRET